MNRRDLRSVAYKVSPLKAQYVDDVCREFFSVMTEFLAQGKTIEIREYFTLKPVLKGPRTGRNPRTGDVVPIPAHIGVKGVFPVRSGTRRVSVYPQRLEAVKGLAEPFYREAEK